MSRVLCSLCQTDSVLVDFGPVCDACVAAADPATLEGALLHAFMWAENNNECSDTADDIAKLLRPLVFPEATWEPFEWTGAHQGHVSHERTEHAGYACWVRAYQLPLRVPGPAQPFEWLVGRPLEEPVFLLHCGRAPNRETARHCALWAAQGRRIIDACLHGPPPLLRRLPVATPAEAK